MVAVVVVIVRRREQTATRSRAHSMMAENLNRHHVGLGQVQTLAVTATRGSLQVVAAARVAVVAIWILPGTRGSRVRSEGVLTVVAFTLMARKSLVVFITIAVTTMIMTEEHRGQRTMGIIIATNTTTAVSKGFPRLHLARVGRRPADTEATGLPGHRGRKVWMERNAESRRRGVEIMRGASACTAADLRGKRMVLVVVVAAAVLVPGGSSRAEGTRLAGVVFEFVSRA